MGSAISDIGGDVKSIRGIFNPNQDQVAGTGQSVGDLKGIGYSPQDIQGLGGGQPGAGMSFARMALKGGLGGLGQGLQQQQQRPMQGGLGGGGGMSGAVSQTPAIQPQIFDPNQNNGKKRAMDSLNFYGGQ